MVICSDQWYLNETLQCDVIVWYQSNCPCDIAIYNGLTNQVPQAMLFGTGHWLGQSQKNLFSALIVWRFYYIWYYNYGQVYFKCRWSMTNLTGHLSKKMSPVYSVPNNVVVPNSVAWGSYTEYTQSTHL